MTSDPSERRTEPRRPTKAPTSLVIKGGKNGYATIFCNFHDLSRSGACIDPPPSAKFRLGQSFVIQHPETGEVCQADVVNVSPRGLHLRFSPLKD